MRIFLDANVLFTAAHNPMCKAALVISMGAEGLLQLVHALLLCRESLPDLSRR